ncbi:MAG: CHRD domain-containing protein [Nitrososphaeraceae archaeon]|nr:CHRD domain-containing protein [Nitrososphaeraceae archaeon]
MEHNKILHLAIIIGALISLLLVSTTYSNFVYAQNKFRAKLDANNEVPPVDSKAEGVATFKIKDDSIKSTVNITGIADVSGAQIFMGKIGQNGDPIVNLLKTGEKTERSGGVAIKGNFTTSDFEGSMQGKDLSSLQSAMAAKQTYVNIMTSNHPDGEVSGHIYAKGSTTGTQDTTGASGIIEEDDKGVSEEGTGEDVDESGEIEFGDESGDIEFGDDED